MKNVTIVQRILPHYRVELFKKLHKSLHDSDINMTLMYGQQQPGTVPETVIVEYDWAVFIPNLYINVLNIELVVQKFPNTLRDSDLVIIEQANRFLSNYSLLVQRYTRGLKIAYWGHGMNLQARGSNCIREVFKRFMLTKVDWWFAYTKLSADIVSSGGFLKNKISILNNSIDNHAFSSALKNVSEQDISNLYKSLDIDGDSLCIYCGGLYPDKQIEFLIQSSKHIRQHNSEFELVIIGDGPDREIVEAAVKSFKWLHYVGPQFGDDRAKFFKAAKLLLMPGLVGLAILDSFISKTPIITTDLPIHSPEISYLNNNVNGLMCKYDDEDFSNTVNNCLRDQSQYNNLIKGCEASALEFTIDKMVQNFRHGILDCLNMKYDS